jgi:hypothetical protein
VVELLSTAGASGSQSSTELAALIKKLAPRWFLVRDAHADGPPMLLQPRWAISFLRGPMTRNEIRLARVLASQAGPS